VCIHSVCSLLTKNFQEHPIILQILLKCHNNFTLSFNIIWVFWWLPSHVGITGNEKADKAAESALKEPILRIPIPYTDLKPIINKYIHNKWQQTWNSQTQNKLYQIYPTLPFLGRLRVNLMKLVSNVHPSVHKNFDFNEIWCIDRGRRVMHNGMQYDPIQGQGHEPLKVRNSTIFKGYLLPHL